ncbi:MAG: ABC transporter ATP-binding protein [Lachnospiraceae bacterium]|nr:ABC transporter ATP-binding protein [Lachnospiraceae bacterium]
MIEVSNLTKKFNDFTAVNNLSCTIPNGSIYGMVGSNGAGKSTLLRMITGVYKPDDGTVLVDGEQIFDNPSAKAKIAYVPDELFFLPGASMNRMSDLYKRIYPQYDHERFSFLTEAFKLNPKKPIHTFSKGMKRQAATILALAAKPTYLFFDETFDGLDPIMRNIVKKVICEDVLERSATAIITSHSLRELEDICDQLALLHKGGLVLQSNVENIKTTLHKVQIAFNFDFSQDLFKDIEILNYKQNGSVATIITRGEYDDIIEKFNALSPVLLDILPLSLEELFTYEMAALGYDFDVTLEKEAE